MVRRLLIAPAAIAAPLRTPTLAGPAPCHFILGFATLQSLHPTAIGNCLANQAFAPNGDAQQHMTNEPLAWRKAANWPASTNGYRPWLNGPSGPAQRLTTQRYRWEANPAGLPLAGATAVVAPAPVVTAPAPASPGRSAYHPAPTAPAGHYPASITAVRRDATYSYSAHRSGTCSHHGGVQTRVNRPAS